ncbi:MAG: tRNA (N(6)-L-threonylcarbamoyladenosine(37)-C(2))-methylthiotransferase [Candidatus Thermoplasmatota archaeon]|nr:tRNA (N(6)-L-threonylcarbamoyladenosine(37)-C(2))-methylthiotransferase [Candidatus Thermoplasmatota archaeon]
MTNVYLESYGCTANKADASLILGILKGENYKIVEKIEDADVLIILTCTVIGTTEQRMLSRIRKLKKTGKKIIVAGCMASVQQELIKSIVPNAALLPPQNVHQIVDILEQEKVEFYQEYKTRFLKYYENVVAPIAISEGCCFACSYCITSIARGKLRSFPIDEIKDDLKSALDQGCKEIQLTSQDTGSFGLDTGHNLGELLSKVCKIEKEFKIRVGMMNPYTAKMNLDMVIDAYKNNHIYKFLHLPVQSGDNTILGKMNRKYVVDDFLQIVKKFRRVFPYMTLSTDAIVGFPAETNEQFQHTADILEQVKPDITNITRFSARPYTKAKSMVGRLKTEIAKERSRKLTEICSKISENRNKEHIGKNYNALITEKGKNNTFIGRAENYKSVVLKENVKIGDFVPVEIIDSAQTYLIGRLI